MMINKVISSIRFRFKHRFRKKEIAKIRKYSSRFFIVPEDNIYVFTNPRGGSTWLMELLNKIPKTAIIWEPFHPNNGAVNSSFKLGWRPFVPYDKEWNELKLELNDVFSNVKTSDWTVSRSSFKEFKNANTYIVKMVRANALLPWVVNNFELKYKPIYLLRHPIPMAESHIRSFSIDKNIWTSDNYSAPDVTFNDNFIEHIDFLSTLNSKIELQVADWCLTNYRTIKHTLNNKWITVFYEDIVLHPEEVLPVIFEQFGSVPKELFEDIKKPSWTASKTLEKNPKDQIEKWISKYSQEELEKLNRIILYFEMDEFYDAFSCYPKKRI